MTSAHSGMRWFSTRSGLYALAMLVALALLGVGDKKLYWHQQLNTYLAELSRGNAEPDKAVWLPDYKVVIDAKPIAGADELSGITYDFDRDRLLAVTNDGPPQIVALSKTGEVLDRYPLEGFVDPEGIAYMGGGRVVVSNETDQQLDFVDLPAEAGTIHAKDTPFLALGINLAHGNKGFEGVAYDPGHDRLFVVKERDPRQLYQMDGAAGSLGGRLQLRIRDLTAWVDGVPARDLADICQDPKTGHLILLSEESKLLVELDGEGRFVSSRPLDGSRSGLARGAPSPEGVAMDRSGNLYVVSEPNLFYAFHRSK